MPKQSLFYTLLCSSLILTLGCSPYRNNPFSNSFHNTTAHYNAYFIAKERIKEVESGIYDAQKWNFNKVLPVYPQFDTSTSTRYRIELEDCIQKASIAIQRHPGSKWEDDSYILVGKARHYESEFPDAIETFKYVNTYSKSDNARHYALTELIRSFTEFGEYNNAEAVTDYLEKEDLNKENRKLFHLNAAYLYQKKGDGNKMVNNLVKAEELYFSTDRARINFIIGQLYHKLNYESAAYRYYKNVLKNHPNYELEFYAKLYMAQVTELSETSDLKKVRKYFRDLLRDTKNIEYQDKIYFELAKFDLKNGNLEEAIENYKLSVQKSISNERQKAFSYLRLGEIYYDSIKNYQLAKNYYDSAVSSMPQDEEVYPTIKERQEILVDFVKQVITIQQNDSLLHLATLPEDSVLRFTMRLIEEKRKEKNEKAKKEKKAAIVRAKSISKETGNNLISTASVGSSWYFNTRNLVAKGFNDFVKKWGDRVLEDNWRRKAKAEPQVVQEVVGINAEVSESTSELASISIEKEAKKMMSAIPQTDTHEMRLLDEIEDALYNLGNIYSLRLEEDVNAISSFNKLLFRFPNSDYKPETLYQLFLLNKKIDPEKSIMAGEALKKEFPKTIYAQLVENPNYREESFATSEQLKKNYRKLYYDYKNGLYNSVKKSVDSILQIHPKNEFSDNLALLGILTTGHLNNERIYQYELNQFKETYPNSDVLVYANSLSKASENFQQKRFNSGKVKFNPNLNGKHFFVVVYPAKTFLSEEVPKQINEYLTAKNLKNLKIGNLILSEDNSMVFIDSFPGKGTAVNFFERYMEEVDLKSKFKGEKFINLVITEDNFDLFYRTKDVESYLNFFQKYY